MSEFAFKPDPKISTGKGGIGQRSRLSRPRTDLQVAGAFKYVASQTRCIGLDAFAGHVCDGEMQAMHVVPKQTLKRRGLRHLIWDPVNAVNGCERVHRRHDLAVEKIPRSALPGRCVHWAERHGVLDALQARWPA